MSPDESHVGLPTCRLGAVRVLLTNRLRVGLLTNLRQVWKHNVPSGTCGGRQHGVRWRRRPHHDAAVGKRRGRALAQLRSARGKRAVVGRLMKGSARAQAPDPSAWALPPVARQARPSRMAGDGGRGTSQGATMCHGRGLGDMVTPARAGGIIHEPHVVGGVEAICCHHLEQLARATLRSQPTAPHVNKGSHCCSSTALSPVRQTYNADRAGAWARSRKAVAFGHRRRRLCVACH